MTKKPLDVKGKTVAGELTPPVTDSKNVNKLYTELCFEHTRNDLPTSFGKEQANYTIKNEANLNRNIIQEHNEVL